MHAMNGDRVCGWVPAGRLVPCVAVAVLAACGEQTGRSDRSRGEVLPDVQVSHVFPDPDAGAIELNQTITVWFDRPIDRRSVTPKSFRVLDASGAVRRGDVKIGSRSIEFRPVPPLRHSLDDGSFPPGETVRIRIEGYPSSHSIFGRQRELFGGGVIEYRVMRADEAREGFAGPLIPAVTEEPFEVLGPLLPRIAGADPRLVLSVSSPVLPTTLDRRAFRVQLSQPPGLVEVEATGIRLLPEPDALGRYGTLVELVFARADIERAQWLCLEPRQDAVLRDYLGRPLSMASSRPIRVDVDAGDRVRLLEFAGRDLPPADAHSIGFEATGHRRVQPQVLLHAGAGGAGVFAPREDVVLTRAELLDFHRFVVPAGVSVTIRSPGGPATIRALDEIRIEGQLILETPIVEPTEPSRDMIRPLQLGGLTMVASRSIQVVPGGVIRHRFEREHEASGRPALALVSGGELRLHGPVPPQTLIWLDPETRIDGFIQDWGRQIRHPPPPRGAALGADFVAQAWTDWYDLGPDAPTHVRLALEASAGIEVAMQATSSDVMADAEPRLDGLLAPFAVADATPFDLPRDTRFVRFRVTARVRGGEDLPSLRKLQLFID